jgi:hypothetical protein
VHRVEPEVLEIVPGGPDRVSTLVNWRQLRADGGLIGVNCSRIFFRRLTGRGTPQIELVEYLSVGSRSLFAESMRPTQRVH